MKNKKLHRLAAIFVLCTIFAMVLPSTSVAALANASYPKDMHDNQNTGQSEYLGPQNNTTKWIHTFNTEDMDDIETSTASSPIVDENGTIYVGTNVGNPEHSQTLHGNLYAINPDNSTKWSISLNQTYNYTIVSTPSLSSTGILYLATIFKIVTGPQTVNLGKIFAIYTTNSTIAWDYTIGGYLSGISSPTIGSDGTIYFGYTDNTAPPNSRKIGKFYALNPDGTPKWNQTFMDGSSSMIGTTSGQERFTSFSPAIGSDGTIYITTNFENGLEGTKTTLGNLYALDPSNGAVKWNQTLNWITSSPVVGSDGVIYLASTLIGESRGSALFYAINSIDGSIRWMQNVVDGLDSGSSYCAPALSNDGNVYFRTWFVNETTEPGSPPQSHGKLYALNASNGNIKWNFTTPNTADYSPIIGSDGTVYFGEQMIKDVDTFFALKPDGTQKWNLSVPVHSAAAMSYDGTLYFMGGTGPEDKTEALYAIKAPKSDVYVNTSVDNPNPQIGDTIKITIKIGNNGDTAYNTTFNYVIPSGMQLMGYKLLENYGTVIVNGNTITWFLGNLPPIDPTLLIWEKILSAGLSTSQPSISTLSYDPNLPNRIGYIIINAQSNPITTTNAQSVSPTKSVGMQSTGTPFALIVLAMMAIFGGIWRSKRK